MLRQQRKTLNSYIYETNYYLTKKTVLGKSFFIFFYKSISDLKNSCEIIYIFFGLMILGINKTPKTKRNNGAIITKNDSGVI